MGASEFCLMAVQCSSGVYILGVNDGVVKAVDFRQPCRQILSYQSYHISDHHGCGPTVRQVLSCSRLGRSLTEK